VPTPIDDVVFDENSFGSSGGTVTLNFEGFCRNFTVTNGITSNVTFNFTSGINASNKFDINPTKRVTWNQLSKITSLNGGIFRRTNFTMTSGLIEMYGGDLKLTDSTVFTKSGVNDSSKFDAGSLIIDGGSKFIQNSGYVRTNIGAITVNPGGEYRSTAYITYVDNGTFLVQSGAIVTIDGQWNMTNSGFEVSTGANFTKNATYTGRGNTGYMYFYATKFGQYNINGGGKNMYRVELGGTNYNAEYRLTGPMLASTQGIYIYANKFISNGYQVNCQTFQAWDYQAVATVDFTGTDTVTVNSQFMIYPNNNITYINGDATLKLSGAGFLGLYSGGGKNYKDVIFEALSTGGTQVYIEYGSNFRDITVNAYGTQYMDMGSSNIVRNFTFNYLSTGNTFAAPRIRFTSQNIFRGTFKTTSAANKIKPILDFQYIDSFANFDAPNASEISFGSGYTYRFGSFQPISGSCEQQVIIHSSSGGNRATLHVPTGSVSVNWAQLQDLATSGAATFTATNTIDLGNVLGWTITGIPAQKFYWIGNGGNWSDPQHWSLSPGGTPGCAVPSRIDSVFFDQHSFSASGQYCNVDVNGECRNLDFSNIDAGAGLTGGQTLSIFGSLKLDAAMNMAFYGVFNFQSVSPGNTITSAGKTITAQMIFQGQSQSSGSWTLTDSLNTTSSIQFRYGTFRSNGMGVRTTGMIQCQNPATIDFTGTTTVFCTQWQYSQAFLNMGTANLHIESTSPYFYSYGPYAPYKAYYNTVTIHNTSTSSNSITYQGMGAVIKDLQVLMNGFGQFADYSQGGDSIANANFSYYNGSINTRSSFFYLYGYQGTKYFGNLTFSGAGKNLPRIEMYYPFVARKLTINNMANFRFNPAYTYKIDSLVINGDCVHKGYLGSSIGGQAVPLNGLAYAEANYAAVADISLPAGAVTAGTNSVTIGNVANWNLSTTNGSFYWIGGTGNWSDPAHWSYTPGGPAAGCLPGYADNVFFNVNSFTAAGQTVTIDEVAYCNNMAWIGTNKPRVSGGQELHVYGSLLLDTNMTWNQTGYVYFDSRKTGNTIKTRGVKMYRLQLYADGARDGEWTLDGDLEVQQEVYVRAGTFKTAGNTVRTRSLLNDYGDSRIKLDFTGTDTIYTDNELMFAQGSQVVLGGAQLKFTNSYNRINRLYGGNNTFNDILFTHSGSASASTIDVYDNNTFRNISLATSAWPAITFGGANTFNDVTLSLNSATNIPTISFQGTGTFNNLTVTSTGNAGPHLTLAADNTFNSLIAAGFGTRLLLGGGSKQTVNSLLALGNGSYPVFVKSLTQGVTATLFKPSGRVCLDFVLLQDIKADALPNGSGGLQTQFFAGASSVDLGNNTNWIFSSCNAYYWVGDNGNWSDYANHWATSSGGTTFQAAAPGPNDDVFFDANSFTTSNRTVTVDVAVATMRDMKWGSAVFTPTFAGTGELRIYGDLELAGAMNQAYTGIWKFMASDNGNLINSGNRPMTDVSFIGGNSGQGEWTLLNPLSVSNNLNFDNGTLKTNNKAVSVKNFNSATTNTRSLKLGSSVITVTDGNWNVPTLTDPMLEEGSSTIVLTGSSSSVFNGNGLTYGNITVTTPSTLAATITGKNLFNTMRIDKGVALGMQATTQTVQSFLANGTCSAPVSIFSLTEGVSATVSKPTTGVVNASFLNLKDIRAAGPSTFNANYSVDGGNNTNWNFTAPPTLSMNVVTTDVSCQSNNDGTATVTLVTGGIAPYTYVWSTTETTPSISNLIPGIYTVKVTDSAGCFLTQNVVAVNAPSQIVGVPFTASANDVCLGTTINFTAGTPEQNVTGYKWSFGDFSSSTAANTSKNFSAGGTYDVTLQYLDSFGCPATVRQTIRVSQISSSVAKTDVQCNGSNDGSLVITASGGVPPLQYSINNGASFSTISNYSNLSPGTYRVIVRDSISCSTSVSTFTITQPSAPLSRTITVSGTSCAGIADGKIVMSASGGTAPYSYSINGGILYVSTSTFENLGTGTYNVSVRDARGCLVSAQPVTLTVADNVKPTITCPSDITVAPIANGCYANVTMATPSTSDNCSVAGVVNNFNSTDNASGQYPIGTTEVIWTVTDVNNNFATCTTRVTVTGLPITISNTGPVCVHDTIKLFASGGVSYSWTGPNQFTSTEQNPVIVDATSAMGGTYTVTVTNASNCTGTATTSVSVKSLPVVTATNNGPVCEAGSVTLTATGGSSYFWSGPNDYSGSSSQNVRSNLQLSDAGVYYVKVTGSNGCRDTASTVVAVKALPAAEISAVSGTFCTGTALRLSASEGTGYTYVWRKNGTTISGAVGASYDATTAGSYSVIVSSNGCSKTSANFAVTESANPAVDITPASVSICNGSTVQLNAVNPTQKVYYIKVADLVNMANSCNSVSKYSSSAPGGFTWTDQGAGSVSSVEIVLSIGVECHNNGYTHTTNLNGVSGPSFVQTPYFCSCSAQGNNLVTLNYANPSSYVVGGSNTFLMSRVTSFGLHESAALNSSFAKVTVNYSGGNGTVSLWSWAHTTDTNASQIVAPTSTTSYTVTGTTAAGCRTSATRSVTVNPLPSAPTAIDKARCGTGAVTISASVPAGHTVDWFAADTGGTALVLANVNFTTPSLTTTTTYYAQTRNLTTGCISASRTAVKAVVNTPPAATITASGPTSFCPGESVYLTANEAVSYHWNNNAITQRIQVFATGNYSVTVTDANGCSTQSAPVSVTVADNVVPQVTCKSDTVLLTAEGTVTIDESNIVSSKSDNCATPAITLSKSVFTAANVGNNTVIVTATDPSGNFTRCTTNVYVIEPAPVAICRNDTVYLDSYGMGSITAADIDNGSYSLVGISSRILNNSSFTCSDIGSNEVVLTVYNTFNKSAQCTATVVVLDNVAPVATAQNVTVQLNANGSGSTTASAVNNGSSDACGIKTLALSKTSFDCSNIGENEVTLTVTDNNGNVSTTTATVTVEDNVAPVATAQNVTVQLNASGSGSTTASAVNNGSSDACGIKTLALSKTSFDCSNIGENEVTLTVTDNNGNVSTTTATVTVEDHVAPVATAQNVTVQLNASGSGSTTASAVNNGSSDACGIKSLALSKTSFDCSNIGENEVTLTVTDNNGNVSTTTATVTVEDNIAPVATAQNVTVQLNASGSGSTTASAVNNGSSDACGIKTLALSKTSFDCSNIGDNEVTLTVTDNNGNVSTTTATVTVEDHIAPVATAQNVTVQLNASGSGSTTASAVNNGSSDACGIKSLALSKTSFDCSNVGENEVTLTVTDNNGNVSTTTATVTVEDHIAPVATAQNVTVQLNANGSGSTTASAVNNGSSDACGIKSMTLSKTSFNCSNIGDNEVTLTVTDNNDNVSTTTATVTVEDNVAPVAKAQNVTVQLNANGNGSTTATAVDNGSTDACGIKTLALSQTSFDCSNIGDNEVTLTVTDNNGNVSTTTATVTVEDHVAPIAIAQNVTIVLVNGSASTTATAVNNGSTDACGIKSLTLSKTSFNCSNIGSNTVTLTVTDNNNNVSTATATVTVTGVVPSCSIASAANNSGTVIGSTTTGAGVNQMFLGYGAQSMKLTCTATGGGPFTYSWTGSNLSSTTSATPIFTPTTGGTYTFTCVATNSYGCQTSCTISICVLDIRAGGSGNGSKVYLCHVPPGNPNNPQTLNISINAVPSHLGNHGGDRLGSCSQVCGSAKTETPAGELFSEETTLGEVDLIVYPNPSNSVFNFRLESQSDELVSFRLYDMSGRLITSMDNLSPKEVITTQNNLDVGMFMAEITQGEFRKVVKITKVN
jgi:hypothetical protein